MEVAIPPNLKRIGYPKNTHKMNKFYEFMSWLPVIIGVLIWVFSLFYLADLKDAIYYLIIGIILILSWLWMRYWTNKSFKNDRLQF